MCKIPGKMKTHGFPVIFRFPIFMESFKFQGRISPSGENKKCNMNKNATTEVAPHRGYPVSDRHRELTRIGELKVLQHVDRFGQKINKKRGASSKLTPLSLIPLLCFKVEVKAWRVLEVKRTFLPR